jgi:hypothetical protein
MFTTRKVLGFIAFIVTFVGIGMLVMEFLDKNYWYTAGMFGSMVAFGADKLINDPHLLM